MQNSIKQLLTFENGTACEQVLHVTKNRLEKPENDQREAYWHGRKKQSLLIASMGVAVKIPAGKPFGVDGDALSA